MFSMVKCGCCQEHTELECAPAALGSAERDRLGEAFAPRFCYLEQLELIYICMKLQKSTKLRSRINSRLCHYLDFQTTSKTN